MGIGVQKILIAAAAAIVFGSNAGAQTAAISNDVVKIGVLTDMSGQFSHESGEGSATAVKMAVQDFGGKVLGKPIEVLVADHQNKPDTAFALARKWFDVDKVDMVANLINSSIALTVSQLAKEKNRSPLSMARARRASPTTPAGRTVFIMPTILMPLRAAPAAL